MDPTTAKDLFGLDGRVAIVTGGTRGIGRAIAEGFMASGARVVVASRKPAACARVEAELCAGGGEALAVPTHMGDVEAVSDLVIKTVDRFGRLDIVVNNAATALTSSIADITSEAWQKSFDVNLRGPVWLAKAALPYLTASPCPAVLNVVSVGAFVFSPGTAMYAAAKAAMVAFTRNMAAEWAPLGIRVNALAPGTVDTDMVRNNGPEAMQRMAQVSLQKRLAAASEMVGPAIFLVSDAASYITGQVLVADGGYVAY